MYAFNNRVLKSVIKTEKCQREIYESIIIYEFFNAPLFLSVIYRWSRKDINKG